MLACFATCGCSSLPQREAAPTVVGAAGVAEGQWVGKADIFDLKTKRALAIDFEVVAREPNQFHLEAAGPFGVHVASVVLNGDRLQVLLTREKKYFAGSSNDPRFEKLIPLHITAQQFMAVLFNRALPQPAVELNRREVANGVHVITLNTPEIRMIMKFHEARVAAGATKVGVSSDAFRLDPPQDFSVTKF